MPEFAEEGSVGADHDGLFLLHLGRSLARIPHATGGLPSRLRRLCYLIVEYLEVY